MNLHLPTVYLYGFRMIQVSLNSINLLIFVMETCCVFFEVRAELLTTIYMSFGLEVEEHFV
jgi:hypothetical protein